MSKTIKFNTKEVAKLIEFMTAHKDCAGVSITATDTGIGTAYVVTCLSCNVSEDVSDHESW